jgi:hypothetical protein
LKGLNPQKNILHLHAHKNGEFRYIICQLLHN